MVPVKIAGTTGEPAMNEASTLNPTTIEPGASVANETGRTLTIRPQTPEEAKAILQAKKKQERIEFAKDIGTAFLVMAAGVFGLTVASAAAVKVGRSAFGVGLAPPPVKQ